MAEGLAQMPDESVQPDGKRKLELSEARIRALMKARTDEEMLTILEIPEADLPQPPATSGDEAVNFNEDRIRAIVRDEMDRRATIGAVRLLLFNRAMERKILEHPHSGDASAG